MRSRRGVWLWLFVVSAMCSLTAQRDAEKPAGGEPFLGTWTGTWEWSGGSGGIEVTLDKDKDGALSGAVSVTGEPAYKATFKSLSFDGNKMKATYDYPEGERIEVVLAGSFEGDAVTGTWLARESGADTEVASGTWTARRK